MSRGRCAGCGFTNASCKVVRNHTMSCAGFLQLYKTNPSAALDPEKEYERWDAEENSDEQRAERRAKASQHYKDVADKRLEMQRERWNRQES